jgi:cell division protein FtsW
MTTSALPMSETIAEDKLARETRLISRANRPTTEPALIFLIVLALMSIGLMMVYSASRSLVNDGDGHYFTRHLIFVPAALVALVAGTFFPYRWLNQRWAAIGTLLLAVGLCAAVLVLGEERNGARRWFALPLGPMSISFQPSELAKFAMVIFMAWFFGRSESQPRSFARGFLPAMGIIGMVVGLIAKEDFGTGALVGLVSVSMCLIAGWRWWFPLLVVGPGVLGAYVAIMQKPFRLRRLEVWLNPWEYFNSTGWHVCQSLMALGSGGFWGTGLGGGVQKMYIPENTTDFIFAVLCEEMGIVGGMLVIGLFGMFIWRAGKVVATAPDRFAFLLASGIMLTIGLQAILNIGVVTSALPAKGISLPFISYGGSGLVMMSLAAGLLASVARSARRPEPAEARAFEPAELSTARPQPLVYRRSESDAKATGDAADSVVERVTETDGAAQAAKADRSARADKPLANDEC